MILHVVFGIFYALFGLSMDPVVMNYVLIGHMIIAAIFRYRQTHELISPLMVFYIGGILVSYGNVRMIGIIGTPENYSYWYIEPQYLHEGTMIWCVGNVAIFLGYLFFERVSFPKIVYVLHDGQMKNLFIFSVLLALFSTQILHILSFLGSITKILHATGAIGLLFFSRLWAATNEHRYRNYTVVLFILLTLDGFLNSYVRLGLVLPALTLLLGYMAGVRRIGGSNIPRLFPYILYILWFVTAFNSLSRYRSNYTAIVTEEVLSDGETDEDLVPQSSEEVKTPFVIRLSCITQLTNIVKLVNTNGFYNGAASAPLVAALVPRFLWPDKPSIELGLWFALEIGAAYKAEGQRGNNSVNMTAMGELFLDFGWPGVLIGCVLFGLFNVAMWNSSRFTQSTNNFLGAILGGYMLVYSFYTPTLDLQMIISYFAFYLTLLLLNRTIIKNRTPREKLQVSGRGAFVEG